MNGNLSSAQNQGQSIQPYRGVTSPRPLGSTNMSSAQARTAWANQSDPYGTPTPLSKQTAGSFYNWGDNSPNYGEFKK
jgi:hypothetical protein